MSLDSSIAPQVEHLHPYLKTGLERAATRALRLHAEYITLEHLVGALMEDEWSAAYDVVEHAFADPETLSKELLALSPGVMVVGSHATLPFSVLALRALRRTVAERGDPEQKVEPVAIARAAVAALPQDVQGALAEAGYRGAGATSQNVQDVEVDHSSPFKHFAKESLQLLSRANTAAEAAREPSIGPAQLVLAAVTGWDEVRRECGLSTTGARSVLQGKTADPTPAPERALSIDEELETFLGQLAPGAGSIAVLSACHSAGTAELMELLLRHKVTTALLERCAATFEDPES